VSARARRLSTQPAQPALIAYGHQVCFPDEPELASSSEPTDLPTLTLLLQPDLPDSADFPEQSNWLPMSGRRGRYGAAKPFASCRVGDQWCLEVEGVLVLGWQTGQGDIYYRPLAAYTPHLLRFWVLHTLLPVILTLQRYCEIFHVGAVLAPQGALMFSAPSFGGKSTLTHYCLQQGMPLLSDDTLGIKKVRESYQALPSYPFIRHYRQAEDLGEPVAAMVDGPVPIHALCCLEQVAPDAPVRVTELTGVQRYRAIHSALFAALSFMKGEQFLALADIADNIRACTLEIPWDIARLGDVHAALLDV
jgi:hypothetical protein